MRVALRPQGDRPLPNPTRNASTITRGNNPRKAPCPAVNLEQIASAAPHAKLAPITVRAECEGTARSRLGMAVAIP